MRLEFGRPRNPSQALIRLPDRKHPKYEEDDGPFEHVAHFREAMANIIRKLSDGEDIPLDERWIPLGIEGMQLLRDASSFTRRSEPILTDLWKNTSQESDWGLGDYRWWQISGMDPDLNTPGFELICVETNDYFDKDARSKFNERSIFDIFVLKPEELQSLVEELS